MAITVNDSAEQGKVPIQPAMAGELDVDLDATYPAGGYDVSAHLPDGVTIVHSPAVPMYDGAALRWARIENGTSGPVLKVYDNNNGAPGSETATADQSGNTGIKVGWIGK